MGKSQRLREQESRAVHRLMSDLRELRHDRPAMQRHMVDALQHLVGATAAFASEIHGWYPGAMPEFKSFVPGSVGIEIVTRTMNIMRTSGRLFDDPTFAYCIPRKSEVDSVSFLGIAGDVRKEYPVFAQAISETDYVDHLVAWHQVSGRRGEILGVSIHRYGNEKPFAGREIALARLLFEELNWLRVTGRIAPVMEEAEELPPRLKQVLDGLLKGHSPKVIAAELGLTTLTVRDHIRRLYRKLNVHGRDELMSKYVRSAV